MDALSASIIVGHVISEIGAGVILQLDDGHSRVALSPDGAEIVARQLLEWAQHAREWKAQPEEQRAVRWITIANKIEAGEDPSDEQSKSEEPSHV